MELEFCATETDESLGELDYVVLRAHEVASLIRMRASDERL